MEKVVDKEELMEWIRAGPVIHVRSSKDFKNCLKEKKYPERNILFTGNRHCISTNNKIQYYQN